MFIYNILNNKDKLSSKNIEFIKTSDFKYGFRLLISEGKISYDYSIWNLIDKNTTPIQIEISKMIDDSKIKQLEKELIETIQEEKSKIDQFMVDYDNI